MTEVRPPIAAPAGKNAVPETRAAARNWLAAGRPVAIATVIEAWGSAPVPPGGQMAIAAVDQFQGSLSAGCVESEVIARALDVLQTGRPETLSFGVADETAWRAGLSCGGKIRVHIVRLDPGADLAHLEALELAAEARRPIVVKTSLSDGSRTIATPDQATDFEIAEALRRGRSAIDASGEIFLHALTPSPRIIIVGATHIGQHLAAMAAASGYEVKVIDPRTAFASPARFDPRQLIAEWPQDALEKLAADPFTAIVTLTHVDQIDDAALMIALKSPCRYIGSLGSRKTHAKRIERLRAAGFTDTDIARIHGPAGLDIAAQTPGEIATSILAEIIASFRKTPAS